MANKSIGFLAGSIQGLLDPLRRATSSTQQLRRVLETLGWNVTAVPGIESGVLSAFTKIIEQLDAVIPLLTRLPELSTQELATLFASASDLSRSLFDLGTQLQNVSPDLSGEFEKLGQELLSALVVGYLRFEYPPIAALGTLLTLIGDSRSEQKSRDDGEVVRHTRVRPELRLDRIPRLLSDPTLLKDEYFRENLCDANVQDISDRLLSRIAGLVSSLGCRVSYGLDSSLGLDLGDLGAKAASRSLTFVAYSDVFPIYFGATLAFAPEESLGLVIAPFGELSLQQDFGNWNVKLDLPANLPGFAIGSDGMFPSVPIDSISGTFVAEHLTQDNLPAFNLGSNSGSQLQFGSIRLQADALVSANSQRYEVWLRLGDGIVALRPEGMDGFLRKLVPENGLEAKFDLELGWSNNGGLRIRGNCALEATLPIHISIGPIDVSSVIVGLRASGQTMSTTLGVAIGVRLGPIAVSVDRVGIVLPVEFPSNGKGDIGPLNLKRPIFLPPNGAGLSISTDTVVGGGFLQFNPENQQYSGAVALKCGEIGLTAIGIITTKMPDGADRFSLLISICATFTPPIQLSFGFTLSGVGGLIGVNRRMDVEALRTGLKAGTLRSILFPDPETLIPNAARIISDMGTVFPVQEGRYVVGPMVKLGWGSPNIITADVGIFLELPEPLKAVILGQLEAILPEKTNPQIVIRLDILGVLEFSKRQLTFQAALYDSSVMGYPVSGDSAFLLGWGDDPRFALSLGGFHPRFTAPEPPTVFANLRRLSIDISASPSLHLTCSAYQALTPNSLQFGAQLDILAKKSGAEITGHLGFDTLIYFSPFSFNVRMNAKVKISYEGETFAAIDMTLWLSGPRPWVGRVNAKIKLLFITVPIKFTVTWGDETPVPIPAVDPWLDVQRVLLRRESWSSSLPAGKSMVEVLRSDMAIDDQLVLHPLGRLEVRQKVPLGMVLSRASSAPITGHNRFEIESVVVGDYEINKSHGLVPVEEFFAHGQWEDLGDRALSVPSFEKMQAGVAVSTGAVQIGGEPTSIDSSYETILIDENGLSSSLDQFAQPTSMVSGVLDARIKRDARRRAGPQSRFVCKPSAFTVLEEGYGVTDADSVTRSDKTTAQRMSRTLADQLLCAMLEANTAKTCFVVPDYEVAQ